MLLKFGFSNSNSFTMIMS